jgi:hypothetical protein
MYDHLGPLELSLPVEELVKLVEQGNYGMHRFLSTLVRLRKERVAAGEEHCADWIYLMKGIEKLLEQGCF